MPQSIGRNPDCRSLTFGRQFRAPTAGRTEHVDRHRKPIPK